MNIFFQINQTLWIREAFSTFSVLCSKICCCCSLPRFAITHAEAAKGNQTRNTEPTSGNQNGHTQPTTENQNGQAVNSNPEVGDTTPLLPGQSTNNNCEDRENGITGSSPVVLHRDQNGSYTVSIRRQTTLNAERNKSDELHNTLLDWLIWGEWRRRCLCCSTENVSYDSKSGRWYLSLTPLDVKKIRAKVWQRANSNDQ